MNKKLNILSTSRKNTQGSILGSTLFNIFFNDILDDLDTTENALFADDLASWKTSPYIKIINMRLQTFLDNFQPKFDATRIYYAPNHQCHLYRPVAYDIDLCAGLGNSTRFDYLFSESTDEQKIKSISLLQAAKSEVIPLLKQSPPRWSSSQARKLQIDKHDVQSWVVSKLHGDGSSQALLFELGETFVQISGVGVSTEQLIAFAQSLEPVDSKANQLHVFMPLIQN